MTGQKDTSWTPPDLSGRVALVAGATRGAGRGIATALGEAGATVYCTGRTTRRQRSPMDRDETIEGTAAKVDAAGGKGIAVQVDHLDADAVRGLVQRIDDESGRLDLLVNDIWGGDPLIEWGKPLWELDMERAWRVIETAIRTHLVTAREAAALVLRSGGRVVEVTDGDHYAYRGQLVYDLVKTSIIRLAYGMDLELQRRGARAAAVTPGFLRSEAMLDHFGVKETNWRDGVAKDANFAASETPLFVGRGIAAMAADPEGPFWNGRIVASWTLSDHYGFPDADGARPHWGRHFRTTFGADAQRALDDTFYAYWRPMEWLLEAVAAIDSDPHSA